MRRTRSANGAAAPPGRPGRKASLAASAPQRPAAAENRRLGEQRGVVQRCMDLATLLSRGTADAVFAYAPVREFRARDLPAAAGTPRGPLAAELPGARDARHHRI